MSERSLILATSGNDGVKTWSWRDNKLYGRDHFNEEIGARCLRFNHNGQVLVSAGENGAITLRHSSGQKLGQLIDKSASSNSLSSSLSNNNDENMYGNNTSMQQQQQQQQQHSNTIMPQINAVSFSSGSRYLACGGTDRIVKVWDLKKRSIIRNFKNHTSAVTCVEFSRDGDKYIGSGSSNGEIVLYNVVTGKLALTLSSSKNHNDMSLHDSFSNSSNRSTSTTSLSFSNLDRRLLASSSSDGMVCIWDITETETRALREGYGGLHSAPTSEVTFSPISPSIFASVGYDKRLLLVDHEGGGNVITEIHTRSPLTCCSFLPGGQQIAVGTTDGGFLSYDLRRMGSGASAIPLIDVDVHAPVEVSCIEAQPATAMITSQLTSSQSKLKRRERESTPAIVNREKPKRIQENNNPSMIVKPPISKVVVADEQPIVEIEKARKPPQQKETYHLQQEEEVVPRAPSTELSFDRNPIVPSTLKVSSNVASVTKNRKVTFAATTRRTTTANGNNDFQERNEEDEKVVEVAPRKSIDHKVFENKHATILPNNNLLNVNNQRREIIYEKTETMTKKTTVADSTTSNTTTSSTNNEDLRELLDEAVDNITRTVHKDVQNLHLELFRQFQIQITDMKGLLDEYTDKIKGLVDENDRLRKENILLRNVY